MRTVLIIKIFQFFGYCFKFSFEHLVTLSILVINLFFKISDLLKYLYFCGVKFLVLIKKSKKNVKKN